MKKHLFVMGAIGLLVVGLGWFLAVKNGGESSSAQNTQPVAAQDLIGTAPHVLGASTARVQIVEFGDYECPACGAVFPVLKQTAEKYQSNQNFSFVFRNFPLPQHLNAIPAAKAAEAAGAQGKFWQMHDMIYANQAQWENSSNASGIFEGYAQTLNLDVNKFKQDVQSKAVLDKINLDLSDGLKLGINSTPTIFVDGVKLQTLPDFSELDQRIGQLLK